jgi:acetylornithine deacetylase
MTDAAELLADLVRFDTRNPGGDERALCDHLARLLSTHAPDQLEVVDVLRGTTRHAYVLASFGQPTVLVNAHVDTVPTAPGWSHPPLDARIAGDRLYGLGSADTKGAIAAILAALSAARPRNLAILFSGDEEHGGACMRAFLATPAARPLRRAIVCEPTSLRVGTRHRGILAFTARAQGPGGHSSRADQLPRPLALLCRLATALDDWGRAQLEVGPAGFRGMCMNVARMAGGLAFNIVPERAELEWSLRPPPGSKLGAVRAELEALYPPGVTVEVVLENPALETRELSAFEPLLGARARTPVDLGFWTEAAMLSAAGIDAVVVGPGDIAHAHAPDESVALAELTQARQLFVELFGGSV